MALTAFPAALSLGEVPLELIRQSESEIKTHVLAETPLQTHVEDVLATLRDNKWDSFRAIEYGSYEEQDNQPGYELVPLKLIRAVLEDRENVPPRAHVEVIWTFDRYDRLIDVWVWKQTSAL
jgi:hypothetical protein